MNKEQVKNIESCNVWKAPFPHLGQRRPLYLDKIKKYLGTRLIKVWSGQRRSGKSYLMRQWIQTLISEHQVPVSNILYLNFELESLSFIKSAKNLSDVIKWYLKTYAQSGPVYLFFDEIQEIDQWEKMVTSYGADPYRHFEIYLTGSNSKLLSSELATYLTGRYVEQEVFPFSFNEYCEYEGTSPDKSALIGYLQGSGIPELFQLPDDDSKRSFLRAVRSGILLKDIVQRFSIKEPQLLETVFHFLTDNIGNLFSVNALVRKLKSIGIQTNTMTLSKYIDCLESAFLIFGVPRYDVKGKRILEGERKYYLNDLGFRNYFSSGFDPGLSKQLENHLYKSLRMAGFQTYVGKMGDLEIDFIAEKGTQKIYVQVAYLLTDATVVAREYGNLEKIKDQWPKLVVSLDDMKLPSREGIEHLQAWHAESYFERIR